MYRIINKKKLYAIMAADFIGNIIFLPRLLKKREIIKPDEIREILVIRTAYIGDVIMTLTLLKSLKERFKVARITFLTGTRAADVLLNNPYVDEIITYDPFWFYPSKKGDYTGFIRELKKKRFDLVIEARGDIRDILFLAWPLRARYRVSYGVGGGSFLLTHMVPHEKINHRVDYHLDIARFLGCNVSGVEWGIYLADDEKERVGKLLAGEGIDLGKPLVAIHPGSRKELKCWSPEGYAKTGDYLTEQGHTVLLMGAPDEVDLVNKVAGMMKKRPVVLAGKTSLRELAGIIGRCSLFICNDSSPMHIAAAMKVPTVAIFGPSKSVETRPYGKGHIVVEKDFPCRYSCDEDVCNFKNHNQCMKDISVKDVLLAVRKALNIGNSSEDKL